MNFSENDLKLLQNSSGKAGEILAIYDWNDDVSLLRIFKNLYTLYGGDEKLMRHWMHVSNKHLKGRFPADLIKTQEGTDEILSYLISFQNWG